MSTSNRILWLKAAAIVTFLFAMQAWLTIVSPFVRGLMESFLDLAIWPIFDGAQVLQGSETNMLLAIIAGFSVAIAGFTWLVADQVMPRDPDLGRRLIGWPMGGWLVVDSLGSWLGGAGGNVILNIGFAILFLIPAFWPDGKKSLETNSTT
jgi:hypothetical protein